MQYIILAAGEGQRLIPYTNDRPKALVDLLGNTMISRHLSICQKLNISDIIIVGGHEYKKLEELGYPVVINNDYQSTNMFWSLYCAREYLAEEFVIAYGDIIFHPDVLQLLLRDKGQISVVVDENWREYWENRFDDPLTDAETLKLNKANEILNIGDKPRSYKDIHAQYIGLMKFEGAGSIAISELLGKVSKLGPGLKINGRSAKSAFMTDVLNQLVKDKNAVKAVLTKQLWLEIDSESDLVSTHTKMRCENIDQAISNLMHKII